MSIYINSDNQINRLYRLLPLYKSFVFHNVFFETNSSDLQLNIIINGLNIKNKRKRINYIYDEACKLIDDSVCGKNICGFKNGKCYLQIQRRDGKCNGCCRLCIYQTDNGCSTKNLACKLFNCSFVKSRYETIGFDELKLLKLLSIRQRIIVKSDYFSSREEVLEDLYFGSLVVAIFKMTYRFLKRMNFSKHKIN